MRKVHDYLEKRGTYFSKLKDTVAGPTRVETKTLEGQGPILDCEFIQEEEEAAMLSKEGNQKLSIDRIRSIAN